MPLSPLTEQTLDQIASAWRAEARESRERFLAQRDLLSLKERVALGVALDDLALREVEVVAGHKLRLNLAPRKGFSPDTFAIRSGTPVKLWHASPDDPSSVHATLGRLDADQLAVYIDERDLHDWLETPGFQLDLDERDVTYTRGSHALQRVKDAAPHTRLARLAELAYGDRPAPKLALSSKALAFHDQALHPAQQLAVSRAILSDSPVTLVHGPPGTGKTRTLIEIVRQAVERGEKVLATATSNLATDNLTERLMHLPGLKVVRLGHPARITPAALEATLDVQLERHTVHALAKGWLDEANATRRRATTRLERGALTRREWREEMQGARSLMRDARRQIDLLSEELLQGAHVICTTLTSASSRQLAELSFDRVLLDEATQASDPLAWIALARAEHAVLAGDPMQLPPTILSSEGKLLETTLFDRFQQKLQDAATLLTEQHRMHQDIMSFASTQSYGGQLEAHPAVAHHTLDQLGALDDPTRQGPLVFIDTAGKGWEEEREAQSQSVFNAGQAERAAAEVRRLLSRGLAPQAIALISPYEAQLKRLRQLLAAERAQGLEVSSIDGFQGREAEVVVLDLVRSNERQELGFLNDLRRINVAVTRPRRLLLVLGDSATLGGNAYYAALLDHIQAHGTWSSAWSDEAEPLS